MAKRAMRPNVQSDLLGFISLNAMGNYEHRSGEASQLTIMEEEIFSDFGLDSDIRLLMN